MSKAIIKVAGKLVEFDVNSDAKNPQYRVLTDNEVVEYYTLTKPEPQQDEDLQLELDSMVTKVTEEMKASFTNGLKNSVFRMLGFENSWGDGWKVDHCNQRISVIQTMIGHEMQQFVAKEVVGAAKIFTQEDIDEMVSAAKKDFKENAKRKVSEYVRTEMDRQIKNLVSVVIADIVAGQEIEVKKTVASLWAQPAKKK